ncbi:hypothetical protein K7W42_18330, partial [Deinococcus sp. HMF7604]|uniref:hypothetical protein n=1 Tax=Deinococcus betulae TaxID=2873312 RepID=UPI001CCA9F4C
MQSRKVATFSGDHHGHMQRYLRVLLLGNLREYVAQARAVPGESTEVYRTMLNLSLAANGYWEHAVQGDGPAANKLRQSMSRNVVVNREITDGYRHFLTDRGRHVTDHTP